MPVENVGRIYLGDKLLYDSSGGVSDTFYGIVDPTITIFFADDTFYGTVVV